jgi:hypothetical protein
MPSKHIFTGIIVVDALRITLALCLPIRSETLSIVIKDQYPHIAYFVGCFSHSAAAVPSPNKQCRQSWRSKVRRSKTLRGNNPIVWRQRFQNQGMPFYVALFGAEGKRIVIPKQRLPRRGAKIRL